MLIPAGIILLIYLLWIIFWPAEEIELPSTQQQEVDQITRLQTEETGQPVSALPIKPEGAPPAAVVEHPQSPPASGQQVDASDTGDTARSLIQQVRRGEKSLTLEQLFNRAEQFEQLGQAADAYLLYFYAAKQGHGLSAFALGSLNDPAHFGGANAFLDKADPVQAHKWYSVAAASQVVGVEERLETLRGSIEAAAAAGDPSAQLLLLNWK